MLLSAAVEKGEQATFGRRAGWSRGAGRAQADFGRSGEELEDVEINGEPDLLAADDPCETGGYTHAKAFLSGGQKVR